MVHRLAQRLQGLGRFGEQLADELAMAALAADGQQHLGRRIHVLQTQLRIQQDDAGGEVVEQESVDDVGRHEGPQRYRDDRKMQEANQDAPS